MSKQKPTTRAEVSINAKQHFEMMDFINKQALLTITGGGPTNEQRANYAHAALLAFAYITGQTDELNENGGEAVIADLLANLKHWCEREDYDFGRAEELADRHFRAEYAEELKSA